MSDPAVGPGGLVGGWDGDTRQFVVAGWDAGPAGLAPLDLGDGITLDMDFASPFRLSALTVDGPLQAGPPALADRARSTLVAVLGPAAVDALLDRAGRPGRRAFGRLNPAGDQPRRGQLTVPSLGPLGRLAVLRTLAEHPDRTPLARLVAAVEGAALAATGADRLGVPALRSLARAEAEQAAEWLPDLAAGLLAAAAELDAFRPASWAGRFDQRGRRRQKPGQAGRDLAAAARRAAGLLTPTLAARLSDLAASLERAAGGQADDEDGDGRAAGGPLTGGPGRFGPEDRSAHPAAAAAPPMPAAAATPMPAAAPFGRARDGGRSRKAAAETDPNLEAGMFGAALAPVADAGAGLAPASDAPGRHGMGMGTGSTVELGPGLWARVTGPTELEVHGPASGPEGRWVRAVRADGVLLALGPLDGHGVARVLLPPGLGLGDVRLDVTAQPAVPPPSAAVTLVRAAVTAGRAACAAERAGQGPAASEAWVACAQRWGDLNEPGRAHLAGAFADGQDPTAGPGTGRRAVAPRQPERPFLLDRFA